jgi:hypothetical protein
LVAKQTSPSATLEEAGAADLAAALSEDLGHVSSRLGAVHLKGGPKVYEECRKIGGCPIGDAVITTGGNLKARHVIRAVGPVREVVTKTNPSYWPALIVEVCTLRWRTICGAFGFPRYRPGRSHIPSTWPRRLPSKQSSNSSDGVSTTSMTSGWFCIRAKTTRHIRSSQRRLSKYSPKDRLAAAYEQPSKKPFVVVGHSWGAGWNADAVHKYWAPAEFWWRVERL